jgi:hypothetical protein
VRVRRQRWQRIAVIGHGHHPALLYWPIVLFEGQ